MQPPVRILGSYVSPYVRKVLVVLDLKGIPYEIDPIVAFYADDEFSKLSPIRRIPVLIDDQIVLTDSTVICEYLDERHPAPPLLPRGAAARARARWLEEYADTRMGEVFIWRLFNHTVLQRFIWDQEPDAELLRRTHDEDIPHVLDYLEGQLPADGFIFEELSLADIAIAAPLRNAGLIRFRIDPDRWPHTAAFLDRMLALPSFAKLAPFEKLLMRTPIPEHRSALQALGAPLTGETFATPIPRRGLMRI
jgi:glutathione S-transferase